MDVYCTCIKIRDRVSGYWVRVGTVASSSFVSLAGVHSFAVMVYSTQWP